MNDQDRSRDAAVTQLEQARRRHDAQVRQHDDARGSRSELAAYTELRAAVDHVAAREAWLRWLDRGY